MATQSLRPSQQFEMSEVKLPSGSAFINYLSLRLQSELNGFTTQELWNMTLQWTKVSFLWHCPQHRPSHCILMTCVLFCSIVTGLLERTLRNVRKFPLYPASTKTCASMSTVELEGTSRPHVTPTQNWPACVLTTVLASLNTGEMILRWFAVGASLPNNCRLFWKNSPSSGTSQNHYLE